MIPTVEQYKYVDFEAGTLPTENFDGNIYPVRKTPALKAEDLAFLYEAAAERESAFSGCTVSGTKYEWKSPRLHFSKSLLASEMASVCDAVNYRIVNDFDTTVTKRYYLKSTPSNVIEYPGTRFDQLKLLRPLLFGSEDFAMIQSPNAGDSLKLKLIEDLYAKLKALERPLLKAGNFSAITGGGQKTESGIEQNIEVHPFSIGLDMSTVRSISGVWALGTGQMIYGYQGPGTGYGGSFNYLIELNDWTLGGSGDNRTISLNENQINVVMNQCCQRVGLTWPLRFSTLQEGYFFTSLDISLLIEGNIATKIP